MLKLKNYYSILLIMLSFSIVASEKVHSTEICPICLEEQTQLSVAKDCGHKGCHTCLTEWIKISQTCPICRHKTSLADLINLNEEKIFLRPDSLPLKCEDFVSLRFKAASSLEEIPRNYTLEYYLLPATLPYYGDPIRISPSTAEDNLLIANSEDLDSITLNFDQIKEGYKLVALARNLRSDHSTGIKIEYIQERSGGHLIREFEQNIPKAPILLFVADLNHSLTFYFKSFPGFRNTFL